MTEEGLIATRDEWRELGFFYHRDDSAKRWLLMGSRAGLMRFASLLKGYVADPRNCKQSEHEHYGPYLYLEIMTWPAAGMDSHAIHGSLEDLARLAGLIEEASAAMTPGEGRSIRDEYAPEAEYDLVLQLREEDFDPPSADMWLSEQFRLLSLESVEGDGRS